MTPPAAPTRWQRVAEPLAVISGGSLAVAALHLRDPHVAGSWGVCPSYWLFGVYCPACGSLRAVNDLTRGQVESALHSNALFVVLLPALVVVLAVWVIRGWRGDPPVLNPRHQQRLVWSICAIGIVFAIARNLPLGQVLVPT